jgi:hypothetical protein
MKMVENKHSTSYEEFFPDDLRDKALYNFMMKINRSKKLSLQKSYFKNW